MKKNIVEIIREELEARKDRSAWNKGVNLYALELLDNIDDPEEIVNTNLLSKALLNGASCWEQYSDGGCALIYNGDIAERLCTASELKKTRNGERNPNSRENWLDCQARALFQAENRIRKIFAKHAA